MIAGTETVRTQYGPQTKSILIYYDQTATALSGTTYHLLRNPAYLKKLTMEIREAHASSEDITLDSIQRLKYLHAVLQEGLRMYPPVPSTLPRRTPTGGAMIDGEWVRTRCEAQHPP